MMRSSLKKKHDCSRSHGCGSFRLGRALVGIAHYRAFMRPLAAATGLFLDDLFVSPTARGTGAAAGLIEAVRGQAEAQVHSVVRWITAADNARARGLYDKVAQAGDWVTYDIPV